MIKIMSIKQGIQDHEKTKYALFWIDINGVFNAQLMRKNLGKT